MKKFYGWLKQCFYCSVILLSANEVAAQNNCPPNIDFEQNSWANWQLYTGTTSSSGGVNTVNLTPVPAPVPGRHTLISSTTANDPFGGFPMMPAGSNVVARLGFVGQTGAQVEGASYTFTIPSTATAYSLTYQYAVVYQDPSHQPEAQPHFKARVFNVTTGQYIQCASYEFFATPNQNGFQLSTNTSQGTVYYKPWTAVTMILTDYIGQTIRVEFINADCTQSGHWAYCYVDVKNNCNSGVVGGEYCPGANSVSMTAPFGYPTYNWWNTTFTQQIGSSQTLTLTPPPANNTQVAVEVIPLPGFGCRDTIITTIKQHPTVPVDAGQDRLICSGSGTPAPLGSPAQSGYSYSWSPSTGLSSATIAQPIPTPSTSTQYILTATNNATSCTAKDTVNVAIGPTLYGSFTVNNATQCVNGNNFQFTSNASNPSGVTYSWDFGDGTGTSTQANPNYTYTTPGTYTVSLTVSGNGCSDATTQTVTVTGAAAAAAGADQVICGGSGAGAVIGSAPVSGNTYSWSPVAGLSDATSSQPTANPSATTQYILTVNAPGGCVTKDTVIVTVVPQISANFTINTPGQCLATNNYQFNSSSSNPSGVVYAWDFGDNTTSSASNPTHQYAAAGTYTVTLTASAAGGNCSSTSTQTVTVHPTPVANAGADQLICGGSGTSVSIGSAAVAGYTYSWTPATGLSSATAAQPTASPTATTQYILSVTGAGGCVTKDTVIVTVTPTISGNFTVNSANQCLDVNNFQFTSSSSNPSGLTYAWDFGDNSTGNGANPSHQYAATGTYTVTLVVSSSTGNCSATSTQTVTVNAVPVANAGADQLICGGSGTSVTIGSAPVTGVTYSWTPSTGLSSSSVAQPTASPTATTQYIVTATGAGGCNTKDTVIVTVTPALSGNFTVNSANQCLDGNNFQFTSSSSNPSGLTYAWTFGDNTTSSAQNPSHSYAAVGSYTVTLVVSSSTGNCTATSTQTVNVNTVPVANAGPDQTICTGTSAQIGTTAVTGYTYSWSPATGLSSATVAQPNASPTATTQYIVTVTAPGGCTKKDTVMVNVLPTLNPQFSVNDNSQCITGNNFQFSMTNPVGGLTYSWNFGDGSGTSTQQNPSYSYATTGSFTVTVQIQNSNGCSATSTQNVSVSALPTGTISAPTTVICEGTPVVLTVSGTANTYKWYNGSTLAATTTTNTYNATQAGTYTVQLDNGCVNPGTGSVTLTLTKKPTVGFNFTTMCLGYPTPFTDNSDVSGSLPVSYSWSFGDGNTSTQTSPTITYADAGNYNVQLTITPTACPSLATTSSQQVVIKAPTPGITYAEKPAMKNSPTQLQARSFGSDYLWDPGTYLNNTDVMAPIFNGDMDQLYTITITDALGCVTVDTLQVKVYDQVNIQMPKAFSPNSDGMNDYLFPYLIGIKEVKVFRVINRWGVVVFQSKNAQPGWDGKYKGAQQPVDGYIYEIQAIDYFGKTHTRTGSFTLIR